MQVDVVTAVHASHAAFLPAAWRSLLGQSHERWRWLVQIDGPADDIRDALDACAATDDPRVVVDSHGTSEGPAVTRNIALGRTAAPLVQNVDADDELEPGALAVLAAALGTHPDAGYAVGHARDLTADGMLVDHPLPVAPGVLRRGVLLPSWKTTPTEYRVPVHPAGVMWRRPLLLALGGWSALQGMEDTGLLMAASAAAEGVLVDAPTLRYRRHAAQTSKQTSKFVGGGGSDCAHPGPGGGPELPPTVEPLLNPEGTGRHRPAPWKRTGRRHGVSCAAAPGTERVRPVGRVGTS